mmetsp:Transcript_2325/g.7270  ORF Transcript_2325/g.7270 Transcript_2325/m.7270 type:complete len:296 (-) Transcript_2325:109-996(-)
MLHHVAADEHPRAAKSGLAVDGEGPGLGLCDFQEPLQDPVAGTGPVWKVEVMVLDAVVHKPLPVVHLFVQSHHGRDVMRLEVLEVVLRRQRVPSPKVFALAIRPRKRQKLAGHDPIQVPVLHLLVVLVGIRIKHLSLVPIDETHLLRPVHAHEHLLDPQRVHWWPAGRVPEPTKRFQMPDHLVRATRRNVHVYNHVDPREHGHVGALIRVRAHDQERHLALILGPVDQMLQPLTKPPALRKVAGPKVGAERLVNDVVVAVIVERPVRDGGRRHLRRGGVVQGEHPRDDFCVTIHD